MMVSHNLTGHFGAHPFLHDLNTLVLILERESKSLRYIDHHITYDHVWGDVFLYLMRCQSIGSGLVIGRYSKANMIRTSPNYLVITGFLISSPTKWQPSVVIVSVDLIGRVCLRTQTHFTELMWRVDAVKLADMNMNRWCHFFSWCLPDPSEINSAHKQTLKTSDKMYYNEEFIIPGTAAVTGFPEQVKRCGNIKKCSQLRAHRCDVLRSVKQHRQSRISAAVPSPSNYVSTSHDQPCAAKTRGKVAALCSLETGRNWQQTNTHMHNDNNAPLLPWNYLLPAVLGYTRPAFTGLVPLKADATPCLTDSASPPIFKVSDQAGI